MLQHYRICLQGLRPLIMHNGMTGLDKRSPANQEKDAIAKQQGRNRTMRDAERLQELECQTSLWLDDQTGRPTIPAAALKGSPPQHRSFFTISSEGSYLHWPEGDVHIDLDAIRCLKDAGWRRKKERERLLYDLRFGEAVAALRTQRGIKQAEIQGLSERQVRRIEKGERTKLATLAVVAGSHGLSLEKYLDEIAEMLS